MTAKHHLQQFRKRGKRKITKHIRQETREGYLFISLWIIGFLVFTGGPTVATLIISFTRWKLFTPPQGIGFLNYVKLFQDPLFYQSLKVTILYVVISVPLRILIALLIALLLAQKVRGLAIFRTIFYLPSVVPLVASAVLWVWIFNPEYGILNYFLSLINIQGPAWLYSPTWIIPAFAIMSIWSFGPIMIIFLAGLLNIPQQLYEVSEIDGANGWNKFWNITIPMLSPTIFFILVTSLIYSFQIFVQPYVMASGGKTGTFGSQYGAPLNSSLFYVLNLYREGFQYFKMGYASTLSWMLTLILVLITFFVFKISSLWVYYEGERK